MQPRLLSPFFSLTSYGSFLETEPCLHLCSVWDWGKSGWELFGKGGLEFWLCRTGEAAMLYPTGLLGEVAFLHPLAIESLALESCSRVPGRQPSPVSADAAVLFPEVGYITPPLQRSLSPPRSLTSLSPPQLYSLILPWRISADLEILGNLWFISSFILAGGLGMGRACEQTS